MKTQEIITWLRDKLPYAPDHGWKNKMQEIIAMLTRLEAALKDEMYRHDRLQDFEAAEAGELARLKTENAAMVSVLKRFGGCGTCKHEILRYTEEPCFSCMPDADRPGWEWKGRGGHP